MRGRSCYVWGGVVYVLAGAIHASTHFLSPPTDPAIVAAEDAMLKATITMGMTTTMYSAMECLGWYMTTLSVLVGVIALSFAGRCRDDAWLMRKLSLLLAIGAGVLAFIAYRFKVLPPLVLYAVAAVLFLLAAVRALRNAEAAAA
jgi:intracellular septation protein A